MVIAFQLQSAGTEQRALWALCSVPVKRAVGQCVSGPIFCSAVWIEADMEAVLCVSGEHICPNEAHKTVFVSDSFHTSAEYGARHALYSGPLTPILF